VPGGGVPSLASHSPPTT